MGRRGVILLTFDMEGLYGNATKETKTILKELEKHDVSGTFFFTASCAQRSIELVEAILHAGHEIGCHGLDHYTLTLLERSEIEERLRKASSILKDLCKDSPLGLRAPNFGVNSDVIGIAEKLGFEYDSSVLPSIPIPAWYGFPKAPIYPYHPNREQLERRDKNERFWEIPLAVFPRIRLPCFGGWWLRNLGEIWFRTGINLLLQGGPATVCLHDWEFLPTQAIQKPASGSEHPLPPLTYNNIGAYVAKAFRHLLRNHRKEILSIRTAIENNSFSPVDNYIANG